MRTSTLLAALMLALTVSAGSAILYPVFAQASPPSSSASNTQWLSLPQVQDRVEAAGYRNIEKIEREDNNYEVKATDADGRRVELYLDPVTGEITRTKFKDGSRDKASQIDSDSKRLS